LNACLTINLLNARALRKYAEDTYSYITYSNGFITFGDATLDNCGKICRRRLLRHPNPRRRFFCVESVTLSLGWMFSCSSKQGFTPRCKGGFLCCCFVLCFDTSHDWLFYI